MVRMRAEKKGEKEKKMRKTEKGRIHIYCGDGKGKTTAAMGLAVRAAGRGKRVLISRFLKTEASGEVPILREIPGIQVMPCKKSFGFTFQMSPEEKIQAGAYYTEQLKEACALTGEADLLILDEIFGVCQSGLVDHGLVDEFLAKKPEGLEVVLTGRGPWEEVLSQADYITEMKAVRHPFENGIGARKGIEY